MDGFPPEIRTFSNIHPGLVKPIAVLLYFIKDVVQGALSVTSASGSQRLRFCLQLRRS